MPTAIATALPAFILAATALIWQYVHSRDPGAHA